MTKTNLITWAYWALALTALTALTVPTVLLSGCGGDLTGVGTSGRRLAGTWELDLNVNEALVDQLMDGENPEEQSLAEKMARETAKTFFKDKLPGVNQAVEKVTANTMQLNFSSGGTWSSKTAFSMASGEKKGTWSVISSNADEMEISCQWTDPISKRTEFIKTKITFLSDDQIRLVPPNMSGTEMELTFDRQPAK